MPMAIAKTTVRARKPNKKLITAQITYAQKLVTMQMSSEIARQRTAFSTKSAIMNMIHHIAQRQE